MFPKSPRPGAEDWDILPSAPEAELGAGWASEACYPSRGFCPKLLLCSSGYLPIAVSYILSSELKLEFRAGRGWEGAGIEEAACGNLHES